MIYLCYEIEENYINLFQLINGLKNFEARFKDREEMLIYIEENFDYTNLIIMR